MEALLENNTESNAGTAVLSEDKTKTGETIPGQPLYSFDTGRLIPSLSGSEGGEGESHEGGIAVEFPPGGLDKAGNIVPTDLGSRMQECNSTGGAGNLPEDKEM